MSFVPHAHKGTTTILIKIQKVPVTPPPPASSLCPLQTPSSLLPASDNPGSAFITAGCSSSRTSDKWNHAACSLLCLPPSAPCNVSEIHPCCCVSPRSLFLFTAGYFSTVGIHHTTCLSTDLSWTSGLSPDFGCYD